MTKNFTGLGRQQNRLDAFKSYLSDVGEHMIMLGRATVRAGEALVTDRGKLPRVPVGVGDPLVKVKAGETRRFQVEPTIPIRVMEFIVDSQSAPHFQIVDFRCGRASMLGSSTSMPASAFTAENKNPIEQPIVSAASYVELVVHNVSTSDHFFRSTLFGIDLTAHRA